MHEVPYPKIALVGVKIYYTFHGYNTGSGVGEGTAPKQAIGNSPRPVPTPLGRAVN